MPTVVFPVQLSASSVTWPGGRTAVVAFMSAATQVIKLRAMGSAIVVQILGAADFTSASSTGDIIITGFYPIDQ